MKLGQNIRNWMLYKEVGFLQLVQKAGFSKTALSDWLNGRYEPKPKYLEKIAEILEIKPEDLYRNPYQESAPEPKEKNKLVPVLGYAACGYPVETWEQYANKHYDAGDIKGLVNPFILEAKGRSMFPYIYEKDKLLCSMIDKSQIKDKMLVVVSFKTGLDSAEANAKLIKKKKNNCILYSINANYEPLEIPYTDIDRIYKVVKIEREVK